MRLTEFHTLLNAEFGSQRSAWISHSHMISRLGGTPDVLIERGVDPRAVWEALCDDFDIPQNHRWGVDYSTD